LGGTQHRDRRQLDSSSIRASGTSARSGRAVPSWVETLLAHAGKLETLAVRRRAFRIA
jgi:hypothetical protein